MNDPEQPVVVPPFPVGMASSPQVSARMSRQGARDTVPELRLRRLLHAAGVRYRVDAPLPSLPRRRADLSIKKYRLAIFVDGCFWHACPLHSNRPKANSDWWDSKLGRNVQRDRDTDARLEQMGWTVLRFWEHEDMEKAAEIVLATIRQLKATSFARHVSAGSVAPIEDQSSPQSASAPGTTEKSRK